MGNERKQAVLPLCYDTYVFDLYGTLVDICTDEHLPQLWEKLALFYGYYGAAYSPGELERRYGELVHSREQELKQDQQRDPRYGWEASPEIELTEVFEALFAEKGVEASRELAVHTGQFFRVMSTLWLRLYPGTRELLDQLRREGKGIYLLSNAQRIFTEYEMRQLGLLECFDGILISSDHGTKKPDIRFFRLLMDRFGLEADRTLFVGNDSRTDIAGAKGVGLHTYYVQSNISPAGDMGTEADDYVLNFTEWEQAR